MKYLSIVLLLILSSCSHQTYYPIQAKLEIDQVTAHDLEEDATFLSSGEDEIHTKYTLASIDKDGKLYQRQREHDGPTDFEYKGDSHYYYSDLKVYVPAGGKLVIGISIIEDDDHFNFSSAIDDVSFLTDVAKAASSRSTNTKVVRGLRLLSKRLSWASMAVTIVDALDKNDLLLNYCVVINAEELQNIGSKKLKGTAVGIGKNNWDSFHYEVNYSLILELIGAEEQIRKPKKPKRTKIKTPTFIVSGHPYLGNNPLNEYWQNSYDQMFEEVSEDRYEWADGFTNKELAADFSMAISPAFRMGSSSRGRFYLQGSYVRVPYLVNPEKNPQIETNKYFTLFSGDPAPVYIQAVELDILRYGIAPHFKVYTQSGYMIDFGGGAAKASGQLRFKNPRTDNPNMVFTYNENTEILQSDWMPYGFFRISYGTAPRSTGLSLNFGINIMKPNYTVTDDYGLWTTDASGNSSKIPVSSDNLMVNYLFGLSFMF